MPAPTLDGTGTGHSAGTTSLAAALTTAGTNRIVCALTFIELSTTGLLVTGVAGGGLTWQKRSQATYYPSGASTPNNAGSLELWWAVAPTALAAVTITATLNAASDDAAILVFGVAGCNTTNPWDANVSMGAKLFYPTAPPTFAGMSTTQANDFLIFAFGSNSATAIGTVPTGFTQLGIHSFWSGANPATVGAAYLGVTATQTNQTYAWGSALGTTAVIFDALTADTGGTTTAPQPTYEVISYRSNAATTNAVSITTAASTANNVVLALSYCENTGGGPAISGISGGGLTWTLRRRTHGSTRGSLEVWSAQATGTLATSTITATYAANFDACVFSVISVAGCNSAIWDANAAVPKVQSSSIGAGWTPSVSALSTTQAHDLVLAVAGVNTAPATNIGSVPSGFQFITSVANNGGSSGAASFGIGAQVRGTTQSGATVAWAAALNDGTGGEYLVDALTADAAAVASTQGARAMVLA